MILCFVNSGIGFGWIYLPAIVTVGYYFDTKRAFATGIAVCGSGKCLKIFYFILLLVNVSKFTFWLNFFFIFPPNVNGPTLSNKLFQLYLSLSFSLSLFHDNTNS